MRAAASLLVLVLAAPGIAAAQSPGANEPSPANGPALRELARSVSRSAATARDAARRRGARASRELVERLDDFARGARSLEARSERGATARELENELTDLERTAGRVDAALASQSPRDTVARPYRDAAQTLARLRALVNDGAAPQPAAASDASSAAPRSDELLDLARDVETRMALTQQAADRFAEANPGYSAELVNDVDALANDARELRRDVESARADRRDLRRLVDRLLDGARAAAGLMRDTESFRDSWGAWDQAIADLVRMTELLPRA